MTRITVVGTGSHHTEPDAASFSIGTPSVAANASDALAASSALADAVLSALADEGVTEDARGVQFSSVQRETRWEQDKEVHLGWRASHQVSCVSRNIERTFALLETLTSIEGIDVHGPNWQVDADNPAHAAARRAAVADARRRANDYASALDVDLGDLVELVEHGASPGLMPVVGRLSATGPALEPAMQAVTATATAVFETALY